MGSSDFSLSLKIEFYQTPGEHEQQDEKKKKHNDLKGEEEHVGDGGGRELLGFAEEKLRHKEK
jgi:hypothetical protein